jgi:hypothetical protein
MGICKRYKGKGAGFRVQGLRIFTSFWHRASFDGLRTGRAKGIEENKI